MNSRATIFEFTSYNFEPDKKKVFLNYKTEFKNREPLFFTETIILPKIPDLNSLPKGLLEKFLEGLHIILGISYYKLYCAKKIRISYHLSKKEAYFWNMIYRKGLGEFFYRNNLNPKTSLKFPYQKAALLANSYKLANGKNKCLIGIGGGKDSIVAAELLKEDNFDITAFSVQTGGKSELINNIVQNIGVKELKIKRYLDRQVYQQHQYSGHIPISAIYAFLGTFSAVLYGYSYFIVGNEYSSNFGNLKYKGETINHQWSKSFEFEKIFQEYFKNYISPDLSYFSLLRPFYEIRIVKMFSKFKKYFPFFSSCNSNFKIAKKDGGELWCGQCPKCVFVFTLLSAFLNKKDLIKIFGKNLYEDKNLLPIFKDVLGLGKIKPFDCVGTFEESQSAMHLAGRRFKNNFIIKQLLKKIKFYPSVFKAQKESSMPEQFKLLGIENVLIIGYEKEGRITKQYLKKHYPKLKIRIADAKEGKSYLKKQDNFDLAVKTPGIKKELVTIPYTTATNIFFSKVLGKNKIIGVTGSKGKSTTSSLIYAILKEAGRNVKLLGNIGNPMLKNLLKPVKKNIIFVLELSSYQLDDIKFSPDIAVLTNLFPEHMDYHNGLFNYYKAKKNIINFHNKDNFFVYNPENKKIKEWLKNYRGKAVPFARGDFNALLLGKHNQDNISAAVAVAKILGVKDNVILGSVKNFKGLPHRLEFVGVFKGIKFYDDASSTNPESATLAIKALKNIDTILLGGQDRGYDFSELEETIKKYKIKNVVLFPDSGKKILKSKKGLKTFNTSKMRDAVEFAYKNTKKGGVCLLSGGSPSYSLWQSFDEKGNQFRKFVKQLSK